MPHGRNSAHDPRRRVDIHPLHRQKTLEAIRQAAAMMDTSPEAFSVHDYSAHEARVELELAHKPWPAGADTEGKLPPRRTRSLHRFDLSGDEPVYNRVLEQAHQTFNPNELVDLSDPASHGELRWHTWGGLNPSARRERGIIDQYEWKRQAWVPQRNWKEIEGSLDPDWALGKNYRTGEEEPYPPEDL